MATKRRLHIWEHPSLHPGKKGTTPVHVVFEQSEYDWYSAHSGENLVLGYSVWREPSENNPSGFWQNVPFYYIAPGMYAKVWEEIYDDEPEEPQQTPLFNLDEVNDPGFVGRERFENQRMPLEIPTGNNDPEATQPMTPLTDDEEDQKDSHTIVMPQVRPDKIDQATGLNLTHIANQIDPPLPPVPAPLLGLDATRLDLHSQLVLLPVVEPKKKEEHKDSE